MQRLTRSALADSAPSAKTSDTSSGDAPQRSVGATPAMLEGLDWRIRFATLCLVWGFSFLFIKVGIRDYAPLQVTFGRVFFGALVLLLVLVLRRERLPRGLRLWGHLMVTGFLLNVLPYSMFAHAEQSIPSSLAGIINATSPLFSMLLSILALSEDRPTRRRMAGLALGFLGVLTVLGAWRGFAGQDPAGTAMALVAPASYALGWLYVRRALAGSQHSHLSISGAQLLVGSAQLALVTALFTGVPEYGSAGPLLAVTALGVLGTGLAFLLQYGLVAEVGPTTAQTVTYFIPVIATMAGVTVLGEPLSWNAPVGSVIVLAGAALTQSRGKRTA